MMRLVLSFLLAMALSAGVVGQPTAPQATPLSFTGTIPVPSNGEQAMEHLVAAWKAVMIDRPGASARVTAPDELSGSARFPYRSKPLVEREETHGVITYRLTFKLKDGTWHYIANEMRHQGNHTTRLGGKHFGPLVTAIVPERNIPGLSHRNTVKVYADMKAQIRQHLREVIVGIRQHLEQSAAR